MHRREGQRRTPVWQSVLKIGKSGLALSSCELLGVRLKRTASCPEAEFNKRTLRRMPVAKCEWYKRRANGGTIEPPGASGWHRTVGNWVFVAGNESRGQICALRQCLAGMTFVLYDAIAGSRRAKLFLIRICEDLAGSLS